MMKKLITTSSPTTNEANRLSGAKKTYSESFTMRLLISLLFLSCTSTAAFVLPAVVSKHASSTLLWSSTLPPPQSKDVEELKHEIEDLKAEALRRMQALKSELSEAGDAVIASASTVEDAVGEEPSQQVEFTPRVAVSKVPQKDSTSVAVDSLDETSLLDGTRWKVMLNIGRETGTWMPKTWGVSGERLLMNVEVEFTDAPLYEREEFLNGITNAKKLEVHHVDLNPTLSEDLRHVHFKETGGWRVAPGEGPHGTDVLRFYIEIEEDVRHQGGDVYCPKGRVYCTCGYFPTHKPSGLQDRLRAEQDRLTNRYNDLTLEMESAGMLDKIKIGKEMLDIRMEAGKVGDQLNIARVKEPEKALLRFSRKGDVGLTKEGGVCCKVAKGLAVEYHILGKFGVASTCKREEIDNGKLMP